MFKVKPEEAALQGDYILMCLFWGRSEGGAVTRVTDRTLGTCGWDKTHGVSHTGNSVNCGQGLPCDLDVSVTVYRNCRHF